MMNCNCPIKNGSFIRSHIPKRSADNNMIPDYRGFQMIPYIAKECYCISATTTFKLSAKAINIKAKPKSKVYSYVCLCDTSVSVYMCMVSAYMCVCVCLYVVYKFG